MFCIRSCISLAVIVLCGWPSAHAQNSESRFPWQEFNERIRATELVAPLTSELFGEQINLYDGSTEFALVDIDIPGNSALPVQFRRRLKIESKKDMEFFGGLGEWDLDVPYLYGVFTNIWKWNEGGNGATHRCSEPWYPRTGNFYGLDEVWSGNYLHLPGEGDRLMLRVGDSGAPVPADGREYPWATRDFNVFSCTDVAAISHGEGFVMHTPQGLRYTFDTAIERSAGSINKFGTRIGRTKVFLVASRVEDRFGNWVAWRYQGDRLVAVESNDGRRIDIQWNDAQIVRVIANGRAWSYAYVPNTDNNHLKKPRLSAVTQPDGYAWMYRYSGSLSPVYTPLDVDLRNCPSMPGPKIGFSVEASHPAGAEGHFEFKLRRHRRSGAPSGACIPDTKPNTFRQRIPDYFDVFSIISKRITGPGLQPRSWTWSYSSGGNVRSPGPIPCMECARGKTVTVQQPDGTRRAYAFGTLFGHDDGRLWKTTTMDANGNVVHEERNEFMDSMGSEVRPFPDAHGFPWGVDDPATAQIRPLRETSIHQDGESYVRSMDSFDSFARPIQVTRANSLAYGNHDLVERTTYHDNRSAWVLGQPRRHEQLLPQASVISEIVYDARDLPSRTYAFDTLVDQRTYNPDGTLSTVRDANGNVTRLFSWKRGVPQGIQHPDGSTESATVDDNGWLSSVTDQRGATRHYAHDPLGRLSRVEQPRGDEVEWAATVQTFERVDADEAGVPAGHWRQKVMTGAAHKVTLFDGLWQPLLTEQWDATNRLGTLTQRLSRYDVMGRRAFTSLPSRSIANVDASVPGEHVEYDALGRVIRQERDSEIGRLVTRSEYLPQNQVRITNPRDEVTTITYLARDTPEARHAVKIDLPEGIHTEIERDSFGKPLALRRRSSDFTTSLTRRYVYDVNQRLCKQIEPETGATVMAYDPVGNLIWSAAGLALTDAGSCSREQAENADSRTDRGYDAMNRISTLSFRDGNGNQSWSYWPDGQLRNVTALNNGVLARNSYAYNARGLLTDELLEPGDGSSYTFSHRYDTNGSLSTHRYPDATEITYAPNALGQPTRAGDFAVDVRRYANGGLAGFRYGNAMEHIVEQNQRGLPKRRRDMFSGAVAVDDSYDYDGNRNVVAISDGATNGRGNREMGYDGLDRLIAVKSNAFGSGDYSYDALDNLRSMRVASRSYEYRYDGANRLTNVLDAGSGATVIGLDYDPRGNLVRRNGQGYVFDLGNRLREVAGMQRNSYDGHGRRIHSVDSAAAPTLSFYDAAGVLRFEKNAREAASYNYIHLDGRLVARTDSISEPAPPVVDAPGWSTTGTYMVRWSAVKGAQRYEVTETSREGLAALYDGSGLSVGVSERGPDQYSYRVRACNGAGCSAWSAAASTFVSRPPRPSAGIKAPAIGPSGNVVVEWLPPVSRAEGETEYVLEWRANADWNEVYRGVGLRHEFTGLPPGIYMFRVRTCNPWGCSEPVESTPTTVLYPPSPPVLSGPEVNIGPQLVLSWTPTERADQYQLDEGYGGGSWTRAYDGAQKSAGLANRLSGQYRYRVQACNIAGCSMFSNELAVRFVVAPSDAPALTVAGSSTNGAYPISWNELPHTDRYVLHEGLPDGSWRVIHDGLERSRTVVGRWTGRWHYRVQACNAAGCGPLSKAVQVAILLPPETPQITSTKKYTVQGRIRISWRCHVNWTASDNATAYQLQRVGGTVVAFGTETKASAVIRTGGFGSNAACWNEHAVRACNASGCSAWSPFVTQPHEYIDDRI